MPVRCYVPVKKVNRCFTLRSACLSISLFSSQSCGAPCRCALDVLQADRSRRANNQRVHARETEGISGKEIARLEVTVSVRRPKCQKLVPSSPCLLTRCKEWFSAASSWTATARQRVLWSPQRAPIPRRKGSFPQFYLSEVRGTGALSLRLPNASIRESASLWSPSASGQQTRFSEGCQVIPPSTPLNTTHR